jgi:hypothetical protein
MKFNLFLTILTIASISYADASPFGQVVGKSKSAELKNLKNCHFENSGINKFTNGQMVKTDGACLEVDGLKEGMFIYSQDDTLQGVILTFNKSSFEQVNASLSKKYPKKVKSSMPFVGDKYVEYKDGTTTIDISSPHMSFDMEVKYISESLYKSFRQSTAQEKKQKSNKRDSAL